MTRGEHGATPDVIAEAATSGPDDEPVDPLDVLTVLYRKIRVPVRKRRLREDRVMLYYLDEDAR